MCGARLPAARDRVVHGLSAVAVIWLIGGLPIHLSNFDAAAQDLDNEAILWYRRPANDWVEALPVGNGRLGAMIFGRTNKERIQINEESLWGGRPIDDNNPEALEYLEDIRSLIMAGRNGEAYDLATSHLVATPPSVRSYETLMDLDLEFAHDSTVSDYRRQLDLGTGIARTEYMTGGARYVREVFASAPDDAIVVRVEVDKPGAIDLSVRLSRQEAAKIERSSQNTLVLEGQIVDENSESRGPGGPGMRFAGAIRAFPVGNSARVAEGEPLRIEDADAVTLVISAATDYDAGRLDLDPTLDPASSVLARPVFLEPMNYDSIMVRHALNHFELMNRVRFDLGPDKSEVPTDKRLEAVKAGGLDPDLVTLYFQYGRYLLVGSSRSPGRLPANLQGIWNEHLRAPWESDYHTNINLQMNYWPAEVANLPETVAPLINFVDRLRIPGRVTARKMYGAGGWTMHHNTDAFGRTGLHDAIHWGTFPMGGPWMTFPVWRHFEFGQDLDFLRERAYPIMKESASFVLDFLIEDDTGRLVTAPSYSPENAFLHPETGEPTQLTYAPAMDIQIVTELFENTIQAGQILDVDVGFRDTLAAAIERLPPTKIGRDGTIQEWIEDYEEAEPGHRHISHLFSLYPGVNFNPTTPEIFEATRQTIDRRLANGGGRTGWSRAWIVSFFARLRDGERAHDNLLDLLRNSTLDNLFDTHPPFQIDGNFGGTAGIAEMLLQSHLGSIDLLPALPIAWPTGHIAGLRARGGFEVDLDWRDGHLSRVEVHSMVGGPCTVRYGEFRQTFDTSAGRTYVFDGSLRSVER